MERNLTGQDVKREALGPEERPETSQEHERLIRHCMDLYGLFEKSAYRKKKLKEVDDSRKAYEQESSPKTFPFAESSNICLPLTTITVDNTEPRFVAALVGKDPYVQFQMEEGEKKDPFTECVETFFNKELKHVAKLQDYTISHVHTLMLEGTVFTMPSYVIEEKTVKDFAYDQNGNPIPEMQPITDQVGQPLIDPRTGQPAMKPTGKPQITETKIVDHEGGKIDLIPFTDMYFPDDCGSIKEWEECDKIRRTYPTFAELIANRDRKGYINIGTWLLRETDDKKTAASKRKKTTQQDIEEVITGKEVIECIECHISYPIYQDQTKDKYDQVNFEEEKIVATIALRSRTIIRMMLQRDIYWQDGSLIKRSRLFPEEGRTCGTSMYGKLKAIQDGASDLFNAMIDIAYITMIPWFFYDSKAGLKGEVKLSIGKGIAVDNVQGILMGQFKNNPMQGDPLDRLLTMWERVGSVGDWQVGRTNEQGGKKTATEVMAVLQEGNIRHNYQANMAKEEFLRIIQMLYDLYYQFMPLEKTFKIQGEEVRVPRKAMKRNWRFLLAGSTETANKLIGRKEKEDLMMMMGNDPMMNPVKIREDVLKSYNIENVEEYINPQISQLIKVFLANPDITQVIGKYLKDKQEVTAAVQGAPKPNLPIRRPVNVAGRDNGPELSRV